jgi:hypothetical protein
MKTPKLELMSMEELNRIARDKHLFTLEREAAARELAKRENLFFHPRYSPAQYLKASDYLY